VIRMRRAVQAAGAGEAERGAVKTGSHSGVPGTMREL